MLVEDSGIVFCSTLVEKLLKYSFVVASFFVCDNRRKGEPTTSHAPRRQGVAREVGRCL